MTDLIAVTDFARSFVRFRMDTLETQPRTVSQAPPFTLNNARFPLECVCVVKKPEDAPGQAIEYVLGAACKAEQVHVPKDIWHTPAADMCLVASAKEYLILKSWDRNHRGVMLDPPSLGEQPERHAGLIRDAFTELRIDREMTSGRLLNSTTDIVNAVLENCPLVSQTQYISPSGGTVRLEYPVKVVNVSEREIFYQVDTGPVLLPEIQVPEVHDFDGEHAISTLRRAFIAHNTLGCTEALVEAPTPVGNGVSVNHYSLAVSLAATNRLIALS
jgi:hypothetical protein